MTVTVHMHGNLRRFMPMGQDRAELEVPDGTTVQTLLASLGADRDTWAVAVNRTMTERDALLHAGDVLDCFEPIAAG